MWAQHWVFVSFMETETKSFVQEKAWRMLLGDKFQVPTTKTLDMSSIEKKKIHKNLCQVKLPFIDTNAFKPYINFFIKV